MTQRDEIFETLQAMATGSAAYICTPTHVDNRFDLTKPSQLIIASANCLAGANPFTDNLVRAPGLMGTGLYLNRVSGSVERFGNNFALTSIYRVNWSPRRNWSLRIRWRATTRLAKCTTDCSRPTTEWSGHWPLSCVLYLGWRNYRLTEIWKSSWFISLQLQLLILFSLH